MKQTYQLDRRFIMMIRTKDREDFPEGHYFIILKSDKMIPEDDEEGMSFKRAEDEVQCLRENNIKNFKLVGVWEY